MAVPSPYFATELMAGSRVCRMDMRLGRGPTQRSSGQAMTEFIMVAVAMMLMFAIMAAFLNSYLENEYRVLSLLSSEYP